MRKLVTALALALTPLFSFSAEKIKVAATPVPHAEILEVAAPLLKEAGYDLEIVVLTDYVMPNLMLAEKEVDANFFQHKPYFEDFIQNHQLDLVSIGNVHLEPFAAYSTKIKSLDELKKGDRISLPNDPANEARALLILDQEGVIKLKDRSNILSTIVDIADNPKKIKFLELEAPMLPNSLDEVAVSLINTNFALDAGLNPVKDALVIESSDSPYANLVAVRRGDEESEKSKKLMEALHSPEVKKFIEEKYEGAIIPSF